MKKLLIYLMLFVANLNYAQTNNENKNLTVKIKEVETLFNNQKCALLADNVCPKVVDYVGGKAAITTMFEEIFDLSREQKVTKIKFAFGEHSKIMSAGTELQCTVPVITELENDVVGVVTASTFLFFSNDNGQNWCFAITFKDDLKYEKILNLNKEIIVPEITQKVTQKNRK